MSVVTAASSTPEALTRARLGMLMTPTAAGGATQRDHDSRYDDREHQCPPGWQPKTYSGYAARRCPVGKCDHEVSAMAVTGARMLSSSASRIAATSARFPVQSHT
jgi:hypothetical protein